MAKKIFKFAAIAVLFPVWFPLACMWDKFALWLIKNDWI